MGLIKVPMRGMVNTELIGLYWRIERTILDRQAAQGWGAKVIDRLAEDLRVEFPDMTGLSWRNLHYMRGLAETWPTLEVVQQAAAQLPWGHILVPRETIHLQQPGRHTSPVPRGRATCPGAAEPVRRLRDQGGPVHPRARRAAGHVRVEQNLAQPEHRQTIGILVCADRNAAVVHYALASASAPMAVSTYTYDQLPAQEQRAALPSDTALSAIVEHPVVCGRQMSLTEAFAEFRDLPFPDTQAASRTIEARSNGRRPDPPSGTG